MIPREVSTPAPDFEAIAARSYAMIEEARHKRRQEAETRLERRFARASTLLSLMPERERERAIELEATSDRRYSLVVRTDGSVAVGQVRHLPQLPVIIAKAGIEAASPHSLASELIHSYEIGRHLAAHHHHDSALQAERERKLNQGLSLSF